MFTPAQGSVGPGALNQKRTQLWDLYSRKFFVNTSDLQGQVINFFDVGIGSSYLATGGTAGTTPQYTVTNADTNLDTPGQVPFDMLLHGVAVDVCTVQAISGTVAGVNDLANWPFQKAMLLQEAYLTVKINDNELDRFIAIDAPAGNGVAGFAAMGTTAAQTTVASMSAVTNGTPHVANYRNYAAEGPLELKAMSRLKVTLQFGPSVLAANQNYQPVNTTNKMFWRICFKGMRKDWAQ